MECGDVFMPWRGRVSHLDDDLIAGDGVPVHDGALHPVPGLPGEDEGVLGGEDGVQAALDGLGLPGRVAGHLDADVGVHGVEHVTLVGQVLGVEVDR